MFTSWKFTKLRTLLVCVLFITYVIPQELSFFKFFIFYILVKFIFKKILECTLSDIWSDMQRQIVLRRWVNEQIDRLLNGQLDRLTPCDTTWGKTAAVVWNSHPMGYEVYASLCSNRVRARKGHRAWLSFSRTLRTNGVTREFPSLDIPVLASTDNQLEAVHI